MFSLCRSGSYVLRGDRRPGEGPGRGRFYILHIHLYIHTYLHMYIHTHLPARPPTAYYLSLSPPTALSLSVLAGFASNTPVAFPPAPGGRARPAYRISNGNTWSGGVGAMHEPARFEAMSSKERVRAYQYSSARLYIRYTFFRHFLTCGHVYVVTLYTMYAKTPACPLEASDRTTRYPSIRI